VVLFHRQLNESVLELTIKTFAPHPGASSFSESKKSYAGQCPMCSREVWLLRVAFSGPQRDLRTVSLVSDLRIGASPSSHGRDSRPFRVAKVMRPCGFSGFLTVAPFSQGGRAVETETVESKQQLEGEVGMEVIN